MSCRVGKSKALTLLSPRLIWVASSEKSLCAEECDEIPTLCGLVGSQANPVRFSKLQELLQNLYDTHSCVQINFSAGIYKIPSGTVLQWPKFKTIILQGIHVDITEVHGVEKFLGDETMKHKVIINNLRLSAPNDSQVLICKNVSLEINQSDIIGNSSSPLCDFKNMSSIMLNGCAISQEGKGSCINETLTDGDQCKHSFQSLSIESFGVFFRLNSERAGSEYDFQKIEGDVCQWFDIKCNDGSMKLNMTQSTFKILCEENSVVMNVETTGHANVRMISQNNDFNVPNGGIFKFSTSGSSVANLECINCHLKCRHSYFDFIGLNESKSNIIAINLHVKQYLNPEQSLIKIKVSDNHQQTRKIENCQFQCDSIIPLYDLQYNGNSSSDVNRTNNQYTNYGKGNNFYVDISDKAKVQLNSQSEKLSSNEGINNQIQTNDDATLDMSVANNYKSTKSGSMIKITGNGRSTINRNVSNETSRVESCPEIRGRVINYLEMRGQSVYHLNSNGQKKQYELQEGDIGTKTVTFDDAKVEKTRLNEFVQLQQGTVFNVSTFDKSRVNANTSNLQGKAKKMFQTDTHDESVYISQKANMILQTGNLIDLRHDSNQPLNNITTVSGVERNNPDDPLYKFSSNNPQHGEAILRVTNTVMECRSLNQDNPPLISLDNISSGSDNSSVQLSCTNTRLSTRACPVIDSKDSTLNLVSSETVSSNHPKIINLQNTKCDTRASSLQAPGGIIYGMNGSDLQINASTLSSSNEICNCDQNSAVLVGTALIETKNPQIPVITGDAQISTSSSCCITGSDVVEGTLTELPASLRKM